jgi:hypothetical protein
MPDVLLIVCLMINYHRQHHVNQAGQTVKHSSRRAAFVAVILSRALAGEAPRFEKGKGSGAKEDPSPASSLFLL